MNMKAVVATGKGGPEVLELRDVPLNRRPRAGHLLARLKAAALNPADVWFRALGPYVASDAPLILGHDGAGIIEAVGRGVEGFKPGERICFCHGGIGAAPGAYAEFAHVPAIVAAKIPAKVGFREAAALPLVAITAWEAVAERAHVKAGETVLIHAGAGGTGHLAVQLAARLGAAVAATVSNPEKARLVTDLGAAKPILYREQDFVDAVLDWTQGRGVDTALDNVGPEILQRTFRVMAPYGRVVTLMGLSPDDAETTAYVRNLTLHALMMLAPQWLGLDDELARQGRILRKAVKLLGRGELKVHVSGVVPLKDVAAAHRRLEAGGVVGKIVLDIAA